MFRFSVQSVCSYVLKSSITLPHIYLFEMNYIIENVWKSYPIWHRRAILSLKLRTLIKTYWPVRQNHPSIVMIMFEELSWILQGIFAKIIFPDEELFSETSVGCIASYFVLIIWCSRWFCILPSLLRHCIAIFAIAEGWLLLDMGLFACSSRIVFEMDLIMSGVNVCLQFFLHEHLLTKSYSKKDEHSQNDLLINKAETQKRSRKFFFLINIGYIHKQCVMRLVWVKR